jgi:hypothetical protein
VGAHHRGGSSVGAAHATNAHPLATASYATAASVAVPPLQLQPPPPTPVAGTQALGSPGLTALGSRHRIGRGPLDI